MWSKTRPGIDRKVSEETGQKLAKNIPEASPEETEYKAYVTSPCRSPQKGKAAYKKFRNAKKECAARDGVTFPMELCYRCS